MKRRWVPWILAVFLCGAALPARADSGGAQPPSGKSDALTDVARDLYEQAGAAYQKGDYEKAYAAYLGAWRLKKHWQIAVNLGASAHNLGKHREAAEYLAYYLREAPKDDTSTSRKDVEQAFADAKTHIGEINVTVDVEGAEVRVDGESAGTSPIAAPVFVEPGKHKITGAKGGVEGSAEVTIEAGKAESVRLTIQAKPAERSMVWPGIAFGVGGAGLVLGAVAGGIASAQASDLKAACGAELVCPPSERTASDAAKTSARLSTAGFVIAGVGAAVGVTLLIVSRKTEATPRAAVVLGPAYLGLKGSF